MSKSLWASSPSNGGLLGLWEYPTAQMPGDGVGWIGWTEYFPYRSYSITMGYFPWLEWNLRLTRFASGPFIEASYGSYENDYGKFKDRAMDLKLLLFAQEGLRPNIAVGVTDLLDERLTEAAFAVATWEVEKWAVTLGYGTDRYNGLFGGLSWTPLRWLELKAEYGSLDYSRDGTDEWRAHPADAKSKYSYGLVLKTPWNLNATVSWQRGEEWCFGFSYRYDLSGPIFGGRKNSFYSPDQSEISLPDWKQTDLEDLAARLVEVIGERVAVRDVNILIGDHRILAAYDNIGYSSQSEALARVLIILSSLIPWDVEQVSLVPMARGRAITRLDVPGYQLAMLRLGELNEDDGNGSEVDWAPSGRKFGIRTGEVWNIHAGPGATLEKGSSEIRLGLTYEARVDSALHEDYMDQWSVDCSCTKRTSRGWEFFADVRHPLDNDIELWWEPQTNDETRIEQAVASFLLKQDDDLYGLAEAGWLDDLWWGGNVWIRRYLGRSGAWIGARASWARHRDPYSFADLHNGTELWRSPEGARVTGTSSYEGDDWRGAWLLQAGVTENVYDLDLVVEAGEFIDGDMGMRLSMMRHWDDIGVGFYYTDTDVNAPEESYTDLGMRLEIPANLWFGRGTATSLRRDISLMSSWNYYSGRLPGSYRSPEELLGQLRPGILLKNVYLELDEYSMRMRGETEFIKRTGQIYGLHDYLTGNFRLIE